MLRRFYKISLVIFSTIFINIIKSQFFDDSQGFKRIIHGRVVDISEYPYQVGLISMIRGKRIIICGGALVGPRVVFTAAHCTHKSNLERRTPLSVLVGANYLTDPDGYEHDIKKIIRHPNFNYNKLDSDFSILLLEKPVKFNKKIQPIPVSFDNHREGTKASVSGWGRTEKGPPSKYLKATELNLESWQRCHVYFPGFFFPGITKNMICIKPDRTNTYYGDSGGPLTVDKKLIGLVSFGRTVFLDKKITVFTRVKNFVRFANKHLPNFNTALHF